MRVLDMRNAIGGALCALLLLAAAPACAQANGPQAACSDAQSTAAMRDCENGRFTRADAAMNTAYRGLAARLDRTGRDKLRAAQKAWLRFRDAEADYRADAERGGTLAPLIATSARADMTESRRKDLEQAARELK